MNEGLNVYYDLFNKSLAIDYTKEAERWLYFVVEELKKQGVDVNGHGLRSYGPSAALPFAHWKMSLNRLDNQPVDIPSLLIAPGRTIPNGVYLLLGSTVAITDDQIAMWTSAINHAIEDLRNQETQDFRWQAAIGQLSEHGGEQHYSLRAKALVGDLILRSGRVLYSWPTTANVTRFNGTSVNLTYPIIVEGVATGLDWQEASKQASRELNKVVALLSVAWYSTWKVIQSPLPMGNSQLEVPPSGFGNRSIMRIPIPNFRRRKTIPKWLDEAYKKIDSEETVSNALDMYHEGLLMEQEHPSFALLAHVASIEAVGRKILGSNAGTKRRFKAGLRTIMTKKNADEIVLLYKPRSSTVHEARLHANENLAGYVAIPSVFSPAPSDIFWLTHMKRIRRVSCRVLTKQLRNL